MGISKALSHDGARSKGTDPSLLSTVEGLSIVNLTVSQPTPAMSVCLSVCVFLLQGKNMSVRTGEP